MAIIHSMFFGNKKKDYEVVNYIEETSLFNVVLLKNTETEKYIEFYFPKFKYNTVNIKIPGTSKPETRVEKIPADWPSWMKKIKETKQKEFWELD